MCLIKVVLPPPFRPTSPITRCASSASVMDLRASVLSNFLVKDVASKTCVPFGSLMIASLQGIQDGYEKIYDFRPINLQLPNHCCQLHELRFELFQFFGVYDLIS